MLFLQVIQVPIGGNVENNLKWKGNIRYSNSNTSFYCACETQGEKKHNTLRAFKISRSLCRIFS